MSRIALRAGAADLVRQAHHHAIPFHIFAAGIYDVIHAFVAHAGLGHEGVHVGSNMMTFDEASGRLTGLKGNLMHTFNKKGSVLRGSPGWTHIKERRSVILLGDSLSDVSMAEGLDAACVLSVAFLDDRVTERLPEFRAKYDVILLNDAPMTFVLELLEQYLKKVI